MRDFEQFITPALISTMVTAVLAPLCFYLLKRHDDKKKRNFEVRFSEYKKYVATLEGITQTSRVDFEADLMKTISSVMSEILADPENANKAVVRLHEELSQCDSKIRESFVKATNELHGLRLVCSEKLLGLIDEFVQIQRDMMDEYIRILGSINVFETKNPADLIKGEMKAKAEKAQPLFDQILKQMRAELGIR